jgi:glycolate oxidase FAD binding subunit
VYLAELQEHVARGGQMLALDPPDHGLTVGDVFDRALFGPRAHRYGLPRDLVLGVRAQLADGTLVRGGGKVVKNVAGYDLPKLFTGAHGLLGEVVELTLRLHPLPAATATLVAQHFDPRLVERLHPACVEVAWPGEAMLVRFESAVAEALAREARAEIGGELVADDDQLWADHRERQHGLHLHRCLPDAVPGAVADLAGRGATTVVGRAARGWLFADVVVDEPDPTPLEQRVIERFASR